MSSSRVMRIGLVGGGTVGGGVYEIVMGRLTQSSCAVPKMVVTKVCVRDLSKPRSFHLNETLSKFVTNVNSILEDESIDVVVEVMGGTTLAREVVLQALARNKSVVTANKALIAEHLQEIQRAVEASSGKFAYEAAVCGGIPIVQTLQTCYTGDVIHKVMGICNGTTNYMLGKMERGEDYAAVLEEAQELGFAEADPTADVEGHDVRAKICILAKLAFGASPELQRIPCRGITSVESVDFEYARLLGCTVKLVGTAARLSRYGEHDGALAVYVSPTMVPTDDWLAHCKGSGNAVAVTSANMGECSYAGPGAGRFPTANSVVADLVRLARDQVPRNPFPISLDNNHLAVDYDYASPFYVRIPFMDSLGIIKKMGELAELHNVSIHSILQNPITDRMAADFVVTTEECKLSQIRALCGDIDKQDFSRAPALWMPLLMEL